MCFDDENESVVSAQDVREVGGYKVGDRVKTENGLGTVHSFSDGLILVEHDAWRGGHSGGFRLNEPSGYWYDADSENLTKIEAENDALDVKVGEEVEVVTDHGQGDDDEYFHAYAPGERVKIIKIRDEDAVEVEGDGITQILRRKDFKKIEAAPVKAEETVSADEKLIHGVSLTMEEQGTFQMLVAILVAQPRGYEPFNEELHRRLETLAESLESYHGPGSRQFGDDEQTKFEDAVGDVAMAFGFTNSKDFASAIRAFVSNLRLSVKKGIYDKAKVA